MTLNDFWPRVGEEIRRHDLLTHRFYRAWTAGQLTRRELVFYAQQYLHHVAAFPAYLTALHCRLPDGATRRAVLRNAAEEEIHGTSHADLWRQFASGMGTSENGVSNEMLPEIRNLVKAYVEMAAHASPATALGAFFAYESQVPRVAEEKLAGLKSFYAAGDTACAYFVLHATADVDHANVWRRLIDNCIEENGACAEEALDGVMRGAKSLWNALDGIDAARQCLARGN
jgi:pyrroloquinoline-quinone synthase